MAPQVSEAKALFYQISLVSSGWLPRPMSVAGRLAAARRAGPTSAGPAGRAWTGGRFLPAEYLTGQQPKRLLWPVHKVSRAQYRGLGRRRAGGDVALLLGGALVVEAYEALKEVGVEQGRHRPG